MVSMERLKHLPEKFAFKLDDLGKRWIRETFGTDYYDNVGYYFHYPNLKNFVGFKENHHLDFWVVDGFELIKTSQLFPQPQIPTIEKGVMMLVWGSNESEAIEKEVMFFDGNYYVCKHNYGINHIFYKNAKPIPQIPEYTIGEAEQKFNIKIKQ